MKAPKVEEDTVIALQLSTEPSGEICHLEEEISTEEPARATPRKHEQNASVSPLETISEENEPLVYHASDKHEIAPADDNPSTTSMNQGLKSRILRNKPILETEEDELEEVASTENDHEREELLSIYKRNQMSDEDELASESAESPKINEPTPLSAYVSILDSEEDKPIKIPTLDELQSSISISSYMIPDSDEDEPTTAAVNIAYKTELEAILLSPEPIIDSEEDEPATTNEPNVKC